MPNGNMLRMNAGKSLMLALAACFSLPVADAHAINRYTSTSMTCSKVQATIAREGAAIMRYQSPRTGLPLYDRYVKNRLFCSAGETTDRAYIPTSDKQSCPVNRCEEIQFFDYR